MPVTTFLPFDPGRHEDSELAQLSDEINEKTGDRWVAETRTTWIEKRWFRADVVHSYTGLYKWIAGSEYQDMQCVYTVREAKAYLYGALGHLKASGKTN